MHAPEWKVGPLRVYNTRLWAKNFEPNYQQKLEQFETKIKRFCRHDRTEVVLFFFFLQNKNRLHSALVMQFSFGQPSHKSFFRNVRLCWGSWPYLSPIFLGRVVVGVWTKMIDQLEETSLELFFSFCSNKLEASQAFLRRLQLFLKIDIQWA